MGYIREPFEIDFIVDSTPPSADDKKMISEIIEYYKATGRKKTVAKPVKRKAATSKRDLIKR